MPVGLVLPNDLAFGPEDIAILSIAFEDTLRSLRLVKRSDPAVSIVARQSSKWPSMANETRCACATRR